MLITVLDGLGVSRTVVVHGQENVIAAAGSIAVTGTPQTLLPIDEARSGWLMQNNGQQSMFVNDCGDASLTAGNSFEVLPNGTFPPAGYPLSAGAISIAGTAGDNYTLRTW